jgi:hypothetical protein
VAVSYYTPLDPEDRDRVADDIERQEQDYLRELDRDIRHAPVVSTKDAKLAAILTWVRDHPTDADGVQRAAAQGLEIVLPGEAA